MKPPAPGSKEAQLKALRERRPTKAPAPPADEPKESTMKTAKKAKATAKAKPKAKPAKTAARRKTGTATKAERKTASPKPAGAPDQAAQPPTGARKQYPWAEAAEKAKAGTVPPAPDFSAACNTPYRGRLKELEELVKAGDIKALKEFEIPDYNSIVKTMRRWRDLAVTALSA